MSIQPLSDRDASEEGQRWTELGGDLDPTTSGLSHLPPSSERMGHYLCVGVQDRMVIAL